MLRAMDSAVSGLRAHQSKLDVIGHNIANVNTFGYKAQAYSFQEAMYQTSSTSTGGSATAGGTNAAQYGYGSLTGSISMDMGASTPTQIGGFNAMISGEGFFITYAEKKPDVAAADVKKTAFQYTRVGQFLVDSEGYVVDTSGNFVYGYQMGANGQYVAPANNAAINPLRVQGAASGTVLLDIKLDSMGKIVGTVKTKGTADTTNDWGVGDVITIGQMALATFQNPNGLSKTGGYYYGATETDNTGQLAVSSPGSTATATLLTGYIEASNVDLAKEFSEMITTQRGFQANSKIITVSDEVLNELVNMKR